MGPYQARTLDRATQRYLSRRAVEMLDRNGHEFVKRIGFDKHLPYSRRADALTLAGIVTAGQLADNASAAERMHDGNGHLQQIYSDVSRLARQGKIDRRDFLGELFALGAGAYIMLATEGCGGKSGSVPTGPSPVTPPPDQMASITARVTTYPDGRPFNGRIDYVANTSIGPVIAKGDVINGDVTLKDPKDIAKAEFRDVNTIKRVRIYGDPTALNTELNVGNFNAGANSKEYRVLDRKDGLPDLYNQVNRNFKGGSLINSRIVELPIGLKIFQENGVFYSDVTSDIRGQTPDARVAVTTQAFRDFFTAITELPFQEGVTLQKSNGPVDMGNGKFYIPYSVAFGTSHWVPNGYKLSGCRLALPTNGASAKLDKIELAGALLFFGSTAGKNPLSIANPDSDGILYPGDLNIIKASQFESLGSRTQASGLDGIVFDSYEPVP